MITTNRHDLIDPALEVVKAADPDTYARMIATDWPVYVARGGDELFSLFTKAGGTPFEAMRMDHEMGDAFGITVAMRQNVPAGELPGTTWLNLPDMQHHAADRLHVPLSQFMAYILAHEFSHREGNYSEPPAYHAGTRFALKLGAQPLIDEAKNMEFQALLMRL